MSQQASPSGRLTDEEFGLFRSWIHERSGILLEDSSLEPLEASLATRADERGLEDYGDYLRLVSTDEGEFRQLMNLVTINETSFFRFPEQFEVLRTKVVPEVFARQGGNERPLRIWSAGCSSGEEPYTIAIAVLSSGLLTEGRTCEVLGTDVSTDALEQAKHALYPPRALGGLPAEIVRTWFEPAGSGFRPNEAVRGLCQFRYQNIVCDDHTGLQDGPWDVIFCRNVTIYFGAESTKRVVERFFEVLNPGGYLFLGHSETLTSVSDRFDAVDLGGAFVYRKPLGENTVGRTADPGAAAVDPPRPSPLKIAHSPSLELSDACVSPERLSRAHELLDRARPADALAIAEELLAADPHNNEARLVTAFAYADLGNLEAAANRAHDALAVDPLSAPAHYVLGVIKRERGDIDGALAEFKRTLYADRDFVLGHFTVANIQRQRGRLDEAAREYENTLRALGATPDGPWTAFLGGFRADLLARTCELGLAECVKARCQG